MEEETPWADTPWQPTAQEETGNRTVWYRSRKTAGDRDAASLVKEVQVGGCGRPPAARKRRTESNTPAPGGQGWPRGRRAQGRPQKATPGSRAHLTAVDGRGPDRASKKLNLEVKLDL